MAERGDSRLHAGWDFDLRGLRLAPVASLDWAGLARESFEETGAGPANLAIDDQFDSIVTARAGLELDTAWHKRGYWTDLRVGATWMFSRNFGVGLGYNWFGTRVDVEKSDASTPYPDNYIAVCAANGITTGKTATTFDPSGHITRHQVDDREDQSRDAQEHQQRGEQATDQIAEHPALAVHLMNEVLDHLFGHIDVGNNAVTQRPDRLDAVGSLAHHELCVIAYCLDALDPVQGLNRDNGRFAEHATLPFYINKGIGRAEVNREIG